MKLLVKDKYFVPYIPYQKIIQRIEEISIALTDKFGDKEPIFLSILKGAFLVSSEIIKRFEGTCEVQFLKVSSYDGLKSTGKVKVEGGLTEALKGRPIIIIEDIIDTGTTMFYFLEYLKQYQPASVTIVSLLSKPTALLHPVKADYIGFEIEDKFVIGFGLDYNEAGRNLKDIYQLDLPESE